jgi:hypothetical protein
MESTLGNQSRTATLQSGAVRTSTIVRGVALDAGLAKVRSALTALWRFGPLAILTLSLAGYAVFLSKHVDAYAGGSDSSGYLNSARLLGEGRLATKQCTWAGLSNRDFSPFLNIPLGFRPSSDGEMVPTYPVGVPLLVAATSKVVGWDAGPHVMIVLHALVGLLLQFWLGRCAGLSVGYASLGAVLLAACPLYVMFSLQLMSDVPSTTWGLAVIALAWQSRRHSGWSFPAGFAFAIAVLIRPTNVLFALPALIAFGWDWRRWLGFALGAAPGGIAQLLYNRACYGQFLTSGHVGIGKNFDLENVPLTLANYGQWLPTLLTPLGFLALLLPFSARTNRLWVVLLAVWMLSIAAFYTIYECTHQTWWYLRFVMPAFPAVWIAALLVAQDLANRCRLATLLPAGSLRAWAVGGLIAWRIVAFDCDWGDRLHVTVGFGRTYKEAVAWMRPQVPTSSLLMCMQVSGAMQYYSPGYALANWDKLSAGDLRRIDEAASGRPIFALLQTWEEEAAFREPFLPGRWNTVGKSNGYSLWRLEPGTAK